ncbi:MAG: VWA domain-containing protein, partial [Ruminococcus sp.]|nr:VWA domain-containing protein [Ruminococcus sp.]
PPVETLEAEQFEEDLPPVETLETEQFEEDLPPVETLEAEQFEEELPPVETLEAEQFEEELPPVETLEAEQFEEELPPVETLEAEQFETEQPTVDIPPVQTISQDAFEDFDAAPASAAEKSDDDAQGWLFDAEPAEEIPPVQTISDEAEEPAETLADEPENTDETAPEQTAVDWIFDAADEGETAVEPVAQETSAPKPKNNVPLGHKLRNDQNIAHLATPVTYQLEVKQLGECVARVALVMDMTGSMRRAYGSGLVHFVISKMLPLAVQFDDDGQLDFWFYANDFVRMPSIGLENYQYAVPQNWGEVMDSLGIVNNEPAVMEDVMRKFSQTKLPVYVIFVTDGGAAYPKKIAELLTEYSYKPIFWQFVGINGSNYGIFENLDIIKNRYVNNSSFFAFDDIRTVPDDFLYDRLLNDFSLWYREIKRLGMI